VEGTREGAEARFEGDLKEKGLKPLAAERATLSWRFEGDLKEKGLKRLYW